MTTATLYNMLFNTSAEAPRSEEFKLEQTQITRSIYANIRRSLSERGLSNEFRFANRKTSETSRGEQAYMTPAALAVVQTVKGIDKIFPMKVSAHPLSREM